MVSVGQSHRDRLRILEHLDQAGLDFRRQKLVQLRGGCSAPPPSAVLPAAGGGGGGRLARAPRPAPRGGNPAQLLRTRRPKCRPAESRKRHKSGKPDRAWLPRPSTHTGMRCANGRTPAAMPLHCGDSSARTRRGAGGWCDRRPRAAPSAPAIPRLVRDSAPRSRARCTDTSVRPPRLWLPRSFCICSRMSKKRSPPVTSLWKMLVIPCAPTSGTAPRRTQHEVVDVAHSA